MGCLRKGTSSSLINNGLSVQSVCQPDQSDQQTMPVGLSARPVRPTNHASRSVSPVSLSARPVRPANHASPRLPGQPRAVGLAPYTLQKKRLRWNASIPRWALFTACMACSLFILCDIVDEAFGVFPAEAGICDGFAVNAASNLLVSFNDIAFDHHTFYQLVDVRT